MHTEDSFSTLIKTYKLGVKTNFIAWLVILCRIQTIKQLTGKAEKCWF